MKKVVIDLERSLSFDKIVFWRPLGRGYTKKLYEAGRFDPHEAEVLVNSDVEGLTIAVDERSVARCRGEETDEGETGGFLL